MYEISITFHEINVTVHLTNVLTAMNNWFLGVLFSLMLMHSRPVGLLEIKQCSFWRLKVSDFARVGLGVSAPPLLSEGSSPPLEDILSSRRRKCGKIT